MEATKEKNISSYMSNDLTMPKLDVLATPAEESLAKASYNKSALANIRVVLMIFFIIGSLVLLPFIVVGYTEMVAINSNISITKYENRELNKQIENLEIKIKPYISRTRIENIAKNRLNMVFPGKDNFVNIDESLPNNQARDGKIAYSLSNSN